MSRINQAYTLVRRHYTYLLVENILKDKIKDNFVYEFDHSDLDNPNTTDNYGMHLCDSERQSTLCTNDNISITLVSNGWLRVSSPEIRNIIPLDSPAVKRKVEGPLKKPVFATCALKPLMSLAYVTKVKRFRLFHPCDSKCNGWLHCHCAGVSLEARSAAVNSSSEELLCTNILINKQAQEIRELNSTILSASNKEKELESNSQLSAYVTTSVDSANQASVSTLPSRSVPVLSNLSPCNWFKAVPSSLCSTSRNQPRSNQKFNLLVLV